MESTKNRVSLTPEVIAAVRALGWTPPETVWALYRAIAAALVTTRPLADVEAITAVAGLRGMIDWLDSDAFATLPAEQRDDDRVSVSTT